MVVLVEYSPSTSYKAARHPPRVLYLAAMMSTHSQVNWGLPLLSTEPRSYFLASRSLPSSSVMSSSIIKSFQHQLLFSLPVPVFRMATAQNSNWTLNSGALPLVCSQSSSNRNLNNETPNATCNSQNTNYKHCSNDINTPTSHNDEYPVTDSEECSTTIATMTQLTRSEVTDQTSDNNEDLPDHCINSDSQTMLSVFYSPKEIEDNDFEAATLSIPDCPQEDSHSEYESDSESDDDIEFSDESLPLTVEEPCLKPNGIKYESLVSSESGYFECLSKDLELETAEDDESEWSESDSDGEVDFCSDDWNCFEAQALSPIIASKVKPKSSTQEPLDSKDNNNYNNHGVTLKSPNMDIRDQRQQIATTTPTKKQVRFKCDAELVEVHTIVAWQYAYRTARKGPWEQFARDRCHFRRRINSVSALLEPCLLSKISASK